MTKSPKIIFNYNFIFAINNRDRNKLSKIKTIKATQGLFDYYNKEQAKAIRLFDYYSGDINKDNKMNIMLENGEYATENQIKYRKREYAKYIQNSNLSRCVVSFNNDYVSNRIDMEKLEKIIIKKVLPMYFKRCGYKDSKKMSYQITLHNDTDNLHYHFSYIEKEPNYIYDKNKIGYKRTGMITDDQINFLKNQIEHEIERESIYTPLLTKTNIELEELKKYFKPTEKNYILKDKNDLILEANILELGKLIYEKRKYTQRRIKYNSIKDKRIKELTTSIKNYIFSKSNQNFKNELKNFKTSLKEINNYFNKINNDNNVSNKVIDTSLIDDKKSYLNNYIYNAIVNHANYVYTNNKINQNDIIEEIVYKEYLKNKKQNRYTILKNYLSNKNTTKKFKNKYNIENAIKNINSEMEDAQKEFARLFKTNDYEK